MRLEYTFKVFFGSLPFLYRFATTEVKLFCLDGGFLFFLLSTFCLGSFGPNAFTLKRGMFSPISLIDDLYRTAAFKLAFWQFQG